MVEHGPTAAEHRRSIEAMDFRDAFWLDLDAIARAGQLINDTRLSTMSMGVLTQQNTLSVARKQASEILISAQDPLQADLQRALDVGCMYGRLIAGESHPERTPEDSDSAQSMPLPADMDAALHHAVDGLKLFADSHEPGIEPPDQFEAKNQSYLSFMRLRDFEVSKTNSDILAFSLAVTQDHMRQEFRRHSIASEHLNMNDLVRLQTMYYAGALIGGMLSSQEQDFSKPNLEILRSMRTDNESISMRMEFEPHEKLSEVVNDMLSSQLHFYAGMLIDEKSPDVPRRAVAILPNGLQFAPNGIAQPLFVPGRYEPDMKLIVPAERIKAFVIEQTHDEAGKDISLIESDDYDWPESGLGSNQRADSRIVGVLLGNNNLVSAYHKRHPSAEKAKELVADAYGISTDQQQYSYELVPSYKIRPEDVPDIPNKIRNIGIAATIGASYGYDGLMMLTGHAERTNFAQSTVIALTIGLAAVCGKRGIKALREVIADGNEDWRQLQDARQKILDKQTLPQNPSDLDTPKGTDNLDHPDAHQ